MVEVPSSNLGSPTKSFCHGGFGTNNMFVQNPVQSNRIKQLQQDTEFLLVARVNLPILMHALNPVIYIRNSLDIGFIQYVTNLDLDEYQRLYT